MVRVLSHGPLSGPLRKWRPPWVEKRQRRILGEFLTALLPGVPFKTDKQAYKTLRRADFRYYPSMRLAIAIQDLGYPGHRGEASAKTKARIYADVGITVLIVDLTYVRRLSSTSGPGLKLSNEIHQYLLQLKDVPPIVGQADDEQAPGLSPQEREKATQLPLPGRYKRRPIKSLLNAKPKHTPSNQPHRRLPIEIEAEMLKQEFKRMIRDF